MLPLPASDESTGYCESASAANRSLSRLRGQLLQEGEYTVDRYSTDNDLEETDNTGGTGTRSCFFFSKFNERRHFFIITIIIKSQTTLYGVLLQGTEFGALRVYLALLTKSSVSLLKNMSSIFPIFFLL